MYDILKTPYLKYHKEAFTPEPQFFSSFVAKKHTKRPRRSKFYKRLSFLSQHDGPSGVNWAAFRHRFPSIDPFSKGVGISVEHVETVFHLESCFSVVFAFGFAHWPTLLEIDTCGSSSQPSASWRVLETKPWGSCFQTVIFEVHLRSSTILGKVATQV